MSERKVLNKYYPPDFDPNKIPKLRRPKNRQFNIRIMAPFNMRCGTCGEYIYKGKKFNSRQERVENEDYLGLMIFRFYIKCPRCVSEISFKTDPQNTDYELEAGATRNFEALRTAEILAEKEMKEKEAEEKDNPMKVLENRTKSSRQEMEMIETLEELKELNSRHAKVDHENMILLNKAYEEQLHKLQDEEDEEFIRSVFGKSSSGESVKRIHDKDDDDEDDNSLSSASSTPKYPRLGQKASDILTEDTVVSTNAKSSSTQDSYTASATKSQTSTKPPAVWQKSVGGLASKKSSLIGLVKKKPAASDTASSTPTVVGGLASKKSSLIGLVKKKPAASNTASTWSSTPTESSGVKRTSTKTGDSQESNSENSGSASRAISSSVNDSKTSVAISSGQSGLGLLGAYSDSDSESS